MNEQEQLDVYRVTDTEIEPHDTGGMFSGLNTYNNTQNTYNGNPYMGNGGYNPSQYQNPYGGTQYQNVNNAYGNPYAQNQYQNGNNPQDLYQGANNQYGQYQNTGSQYGQYQNTNNQYGQYQNAGSPYNQYQYGNNANAQYQYGNNPNAQYQYGNGQYSNPYANNYPYNNPYSPYAAPQKKKSTGLIVGVIITLVVLFLVALFALIYHAFESLSDSDRNNMGYGRDYPDYDYGNDYGYGDGFDYDYGYGYGNDFGFDYGYGNDYGYDYGFGNDYGFDYGYGNDYGYDFDFDKDYEEDYDYDSDKYYTLHDDVKKDLSYSIDWESYKYDTDKENVSIVVDYPVIKGEKVPNLDKLNETIAKEVEDFTDYYEDDYSKHLIDDDSYFQAYSAGYVTYMSEDILSIAFSEYMYSDYDSLVYLKSINIDMKDGVIMDNTGIIDVDDEFSVDFRTRSNNQNGSISSLDGMADQEITKYLTSADNLIIFYVPQGLEIGFNYRDGWVTVTYKDYEEFLKIF